MKTVQLHPPDLSQMLLSGDLQRQNRALKSLYQSPVVNGKVREWARLYNLQGKTADDVLQEGVVLLYDLVLQGRFRGESKAETFLLGICKNIIRDGLKKVNRIQLKESFTDADLHSEDEMADQIIVREAEEMEQRRDRELEGAFEQLTGNCRDSLKLYYYQNKSMADIAAARNLANAEQAKKAVHRCRESLRNILKANANMQSILKQLS